MESHSPEYSGGGAVGVCGGGVVSITIPQERESHEYFGFPGHIKVMFTPMYVASLRNT